MKSSSGGLVRLDRLLALSVFQRLADLSSAARGLRIPILMYHSVACDVDDNLHPYFRTVTRPESFQRQVNLLREAGYEAITLTEAVNFLLACIGNTTPSQPPGTERLANQEGREEGKRRLVVFTFDDGFRDFYTTAFPILSQSGFRATVFLASGYIGKTFLTGRHCLQVHEIRELAKEGVEFGSHTVSHRRLQELPKHEIARELAVSKQMIEGIVATEVSTFSYPYRFPQEDATFRGQLGTLLDEQGYRAGVTTAIGRFTPEDDLRFLPRLPINDCDDDRLLRAKLEGGYDWLQKAQVMYKRSRALLRTSGSA